uniref:Uncharacterized protein n=1 Tax=Nelumbo nucifera TaxID=4432 RepID=A0A822Y9S4_NELNU|nr:TPA_asm: hypothetical protein HUJ06_030530 [Nelumbo nucifera]
MKTIRSIDLSLLRARVVVDKEKMRVASPTS